MLLDAIKADGLQARKDRSAANGVLNALLGEIDTKTKTFNPARPMTDAEVLAIIQKFLKNNAEAISLIGRLPEERRAAELAKLEAEASALGRYVPQQMGEADIEAFVRGKVADGLNAMGPIMAALKGERGGRYDGKLASAVVKRVLG